MCGEVSRFAVFHVRGTRWLKVDVGFVIVNWTHISIEVREKESNERCVSASVIVSILTCSF